MDVLLTEYHKQQVDRMLKLTAQNYEKAVKNLVKAEKDLEKVAKQSNCEHKHLKYFGGYIHDITQCHDCGFKWYD